MSLRPRYTYRAKARDLSRLARIVATVAARGIKLLAPPTASTARSILTRRYTDQETIR